MNKKKLIGTIIGVIMFGLLMAGATYAWLSFNATVVNAKYNTHTVNYWVNYTKGTDLSDMPILSSTATPSNTLSATITAVKPTGSLVDHLNIHLTTSTDNILTKDSDDDDDGKYLINYALCEGTCSESFTSAVATGYIDQDFYDNATTKTIDIYTDHYDTALTANATFTYTMYFWIDAEELENRHLNLTYSGYIHASANQADQEEK